MTRSLTLIALTIVVVARAPAYGEAAATPIPPVDEAENDSERSLQTPGEITGAGVEPGQACFEALVTGVVDPENCKDVTAFSSGDQSNLALMLMRAEEWEQAEATFDAARALAPGDPHIWSNLGNLLLKRGRTTEAIKAYDQALVLAGGIDPVALYNRAIARGAAGDHPGAAEDLEALQRVLDRYARLEATAPGDSESTGTLSRRSVFD